MGGELRDGGGGGADGDGAAVAAGVGGERGLAAGRAVAGGDCAGTEEAGERWGEED